MQGPLVSIIIPTFNRAHLIGETLDSVLAQTYQNWECIVVDDGSTDNSEELLAEYIAKDARFQYHHRPKDRLPGGNAARNYGFEKSSGEYVNWFDSDDLMHPQKLQLQMELLLKTQKAFCVCQTLVFNEKIENIIGLRKKYVFSNDPLNDFIRSKITWLTQAPILKKSFLQTNQLKFDEKLLKAQEYEFFIRVLYVNSDYAYTDEPLVYLRIHSDRISNNDYVPSKSYSVFMAALNSFNLVWDSITIEARNELIRRMINQIYLSVDNKDMENARKMFNQFMGLNTTKKHKFWVKIGWYIFQITNNKKTLSFMGSKKKKSLRSFVRYNYTL